MYESLVLIVILKLVMVIVILGGGIAVFRELIPMARGRRSVAQPDQQPPGKDA